ncbi:MAG: hypothetical protein ACREP7_23450 [Lysobacter sp.]
MQLLDINLLQMEQMLRVSRSTIHKAPGSHKIQMELRIFIKVLAAARTNCNDVGQLVFWFMSVPLENFYYATPFELYAKGGANELIAFLEQARSNGRGLAGVWEEELRAV